MNSPDFVSFSDVDLLRVVTSGGRRPNVLVDCTHRSPVDVIARLRTLCAPPVHVCQLPGALELPTNGFGTLLLHDLSALTIRQQVELADWLHRRQGAIQVISISQSPIEPLVRDGRFLEGLFYRLNTISISAGDERRS